MEKRTGIEFRRKTFLFLSLSFLTSNDTPNDRSVSIDVPRRKREGIEKRRRRIRSRREKERERKGD